METRLVRISEYVKRVNLMEDLTSFHPDYLDRLEVGDRELLRKHCFAGRDIDVSSAREHRLTEIRLNVGEVIQADLAWKAFERVADLR